MRFFEFDMERMKESSVPGVSLGDFGQNLPSALQTICSDANRKEVLMAWIRALTPMDVGDIRFPQLIHHGNASIPDESRRNEPDAKFRARKRRLTAP